MPPTQLFTGAPRSDFSTGRGFGDQICLRISNMTNCMACAVSTSEFDRCAGCIPAQFLEIVIAET